MAAHISRGLHLYFGVDDGGETWLRMNHELPLWFALEPACDWDRVQARCLVSRVILSHHQTTITLNRTVAAMFI